MTATLAVRRTAGTPSPAARRVPFHALVPGGVALGLGLWGVGVPSYWRDESFTVVAARLPWHDLWRLLERMDAAHGLYYALMHVVTATLGTGETATRLPSVSATAVAAAGLAALTSRLVGSAGSRARFPAPGALSDRARLAGLYTGLIYALLPGVSRYAQEARSYALVSAGAILATWLLLQALERPRRFLPYAVLITALAWLHLHSLLLLPAHALMILALGPRRRLVPWLVAAATAAQAATPLALRAHTQSALMSYWIPTPGPEAPASFLLLATGSPAVLAVLLMICGAPLVSGRPIPGRRGLWVGALWLSVPLGVALVASQITPLYQARYVLFALPGLALLAGVGLERVTRRRARLGLAAVALVGLVGAPQQVAIREPGSRPDDLRSMAAVLRAQGRPGDAVVVVPAYREPMVTVYRDAFARLDQRTLSGVDGLDLATPTFRDALRHAGRVWVVECPPPLGRYPDGVAPANLDVLRRTRARIGAWTFGSVQLYLHASGDYIP